MCRRPSRDDSELQQSKTGAQLGLHPFGEREVMRPRQTIGEEKLSKMAKMRTFAPSNPATGADQDGIFHEHLQVEKKPTMDDGGANLMGTAGFG